MGKIIIFCFNYLHPFNTATIRLGNQGLFKIINNSMEVHHHSHTSRKKWTHYLWEFIMLFLAVFCGFLAENMREHMVERQREKKYIRSLIQDIRTDSLQITGWLQRYGEMKLSCDSVLDYFPVTPDIPVEWGRNMQVITTGFPDFISTDQTMQQLKNAGGLRLIRNMAAVDSINTYDVAVRDVQLEETAISNYYLAISQKTDQLISYRNISSRAKKSTSKDSWIHFDPMENERLFNLVFRYRIEINGFMDELEDLKNEGASLVMFLQKEYHLK